MDFFKRYWSWMVAFLLALLLVTGYRVLFGPPTNFSPGKVHITSGASASEVSRELVDARIIKHSSIFRFLLRISGTSLQVQAGTYLFTSPPNLFVVGYRLVTGSYGIPPVRMTFPEGETTRDMAERVHEALPEISASDFLSKAQPYEGYLFPDTYLFQSSSDITTIIATMRANFDTKLTSVSRDIATSGHSLSTIVTMASLIEKEARSSAVRRVVAGILWNRLARGMPLQVDAVFGYIFNRDTYSPSYADLKVDSPYNTYTHTGLPPGPINNPGLDSIDAALHPTQTDYLYYLTDTNGVMHYATTFAGHQANQRKYLK